MSNPNPVNMAASVEAKLKNITAERGIDYRFILIRYATERFFLSSEHFSLCRSVCSERRKPFCDLAKRP